MILGGGSNLAGFVSGNGKPSHGWDKPHFDNISPRNITAIVGQTAELSCYVKYPGDRTVSFLIENIRLIGQRLLIDYLPVQSWTNKARKKATMIMRKFHLEIEMSIFPEFESLVEWSD